MVLDKERFLSLSPEEQERVFRANYRKYLQEMPHRIDATILSDYVAAEARTRVIKETKEIGDNAPIELFELWLRVIRKEIKQVRPDLA